MGWRAGWGGGQGGEAGRIGWRAGLDGWQYAVAGQVGAGWVGWLAGGQNGVDLRSKECSGVNIVT